MSCTPLLQDAVGIGLQKLAGLVGESPSSVLKPRSSLIPILVVEKSVAIFKRHVRPAENGTMCIFVAMAGLRIQKRKTVTQEGTDV